MIKLYRTEEGPVACQNEVYHRVSGASWDELLARPDVLQFLGSGIAGGQYARVNPPRQPLAPIEGQEVWAAGVTYRRSKEARMADARSPGADDFYDRVYSAQRPELFFKATARRVVGTGQAVRIRKDSKWNVPEPELTLLIAATGEITGYTIGNDMSSRDIEAENPLYLPQAKVYDGCCALGPCLLLSNDPLPAQTKIEIQIQRSGSNVFAGETAISQIKRPLPSLAKYLYLENAFPAGCFLMTGTGIVPPDSFTLACGDEIVITIAPIGTLENIVK
jgi:2-dehydro-3-deoxy-D-arabinonate dehydratase